MKPRIVYHVTHRENLDSILRDGLICEAAQLSPRVWFFTKCKYRWAIPHVCATHVWQSRDLVILRLELSRFHHDCLTRARRGVWYSQFAITPEEIKSWRFYDDGKLRISDL